MPEHLSKCCNAQLIPKTGFDQQYFSRCSECGTTYAARLTFMTESTKKQTVTSDKSAQIDAQVKTASDAVLAEYAVWTGNDITSSNFKQLEQRVYSLIKQAELRSRDTLAQELLDFAGKNQNIEVLAGYIGGKMIIAKDQLKDLEDE
jgi:DNA-directed RNA polymerase subunit M/transcription elongation factor TFIIS